jgi:hypothetical protein
MYRQRRDLHGRPKRATLSRIKCGTIDEQRSMVFVAVELVSFLPVFLQQQKSKDIELHVSL